jgi:hypothetical protein
MDNELAYKNLTKINLERKNDRIQGIYLETALILVLREANIYFTYRNF